MIKNTDWKSKEELILSNLRYVYDEAQPLLIKTYGATVIDPHMASRLENYIQQFDFLVLDPLLSFFGSNENDNSSARLFLNALSRLVRGTKKSILLIHHTGKSKADNEDDPYKILEVLKNQIRGASAFVDGVRTALYLKKNRDNEKVRELIVVKSNIGKIGEKQTIQMPFENKVHKIKV
jgi:RecA-family ATPase